MLRRIVHFLADSRTLRALGAILLISLAAVGVQAALAPLRPGPGPLSTAAMLTTAGAALLIAAAPLLAYTLLVRLVERRWPTEALPAPGKLLLGAAAGVGLSAATVAVLYALGVYRVDSIAGREEWAGILVRAAAGSLVAGVAEETIFRGVVLRLAEQRLGSFWALTLSAVLFGAAHAFNPNATILSSAAIALEAGVLLGAAYMLTRSLWAPIGLHAAWNFMQAAVVGGALSGSEVRSILRASLGDPAWLSGGAFGIEASPIAAILCTAAGVGLFIAARRRGTLIPRSWPAARPAAPAASHGAIGAA